jgi:hypothetical protein
VQLEGQVTYHAHYLLKLTEHAIDPGCYLWAAARPHVLQRQACQEGMFCDAVQHAKAPGNANIGATPGLRRAPDRGDAASRVVFSRGIREPAPRRFQPSVTVSE